MNEAATPNPSRLQAALPLVPIAALALVPALLALRFGGYHPRHAGWVVIGLAAWACVQGARGRLRELQGLAGYATVALLLLVGWTTASIAWVDASSHDAWVEATRALGYAAVFVLGTSLLASATSLARFVGLTGACFALLGVATSIRLAFFDFPLRTFVAGRLDWPVGYAPGLAGTYLFAMLLLLGASCTADRRWRERRARIDLAVAGLALGAAGSCAALALLAQSRGTLPALLVGIVVSLVAVPERLAWLLRLLLVAGGVAALHARFTAPFQTQFHLRQAPFTEGADPDALLATAQEAAKAAGIGALLLLIALTALGAALPLLTSRIGATGRRARLPLAVAGVALVATLAVTALAGGDRSPTAWVADQWRGCIDPPERVNDPGKASSYFANSGTGRCDYYRVAFDNFRDEPVYGVGAGNFHSRYVLDRRTAEEPSVAHSLPLQMLGELGIVGGLLAATVLGCVLLATRRFIAGGPIRNPAIAGGVGALGYWTTHASIDWMWQLPSVTLPAMALAGGLVGMVSAPQARVRASVAAPVAAGVLLACIALVLPITMADSALRRARDPDLRRDDPSAALEAALDAQRFDPGWAEPAITEGVLEYAAGNRARAAAAARRAVELEPRSWSVQFRASGLIGLDDTAEGLAAFQAARALNPRLPADVTSEDKAAGTDDDADNIEDKDAEAAPARPA